VEGRRHPEFFAALPDRVVVVLAVVTEGIDPTCGSDALAARDGAGDDARAHHRLEAELANGIVEFLDGFFGGEHRDGGHRFEPVAELGIDLGVVAVVGPCSGSAQLVVVEGGDRETVGGEEQGEVESDFVHALVHEAREHRGGAVEGVAGGQAPPREARHAQVTPLLDGDLARQAAALAQHVEARSDFLAGDLDQEVPDQWRVLDEVTIAIDDRVVEALADGPDRVAGLVLHWGFLLKSGSSLKLRAGRVKRSS
jgi:hypothetical protein